MSSSVWDSAIFELSTITLDLPTNEREINDRGNPEVVAQKVTFQARFLPDTQTRSTTLKHDESTASSELSLTGRTLKPLDKRIKPGLICKGVINGVEGDVEFLPIAQNSIKAITRALGSRVRIRFTQSSKGVDRA